MDYNIIKAYLTEKSLKNKESVKILDIFNSNDNYIKVKYCSIFDTNNYTIQEIWILDLLEFIYNKGN